MLGTNGRVMANLDANSNDSALTSSICSQEAGYIITKDIHGIG